MSGPLRIEFPGGLYHVTSRGDRREAIYLDDAQFVLMHASDKPHFVIPAQAGIQRSEQKTLMNARYAHLDSRLRGNDNG